MNTTRPDLVIGQVTAFDAEINALKPVNDPCFCSMLQVAIVTKMKLNKTFLSEATPVWS